jgi:hypothetical protein
MTFRRSENLKSQVKFLTTLNNSASAFWDIVLCSLVETYHFKCNIYFINLTFRRNLMPLPSGWKSMPRGKTPVDRLEQAARGSG